MASGTSSPGKSTRSGSKKESFQWNTPADEFADDVGSDDEGEYMDRGDQDGEEETTTVIVTEMTEGEISASGQDGGMVIHLGAEEAEKYAVRKREPGSAIESNEEIQKFIDNYGVAPGVEGVVAVKSKEPKKPKQKFQCPKCDKVWNWPWELRRHVMTHYKEVSKKLR